MPYAKEADLLNVAPFGFTAKAWREANIELEKIYNEIKKEEKLKKTSEEYIRILKESAITEEICETIKKIRENYRPTEALPDWFRCLVYHETLHILRNTTLTQTQILKKMGLSNEIFTKNWKMISPSFRHSQEQFIDINIPFRHNEAEASRVYRALIHYILGNIDRPVKPETIVDSFGKLGLFLGVAANGFHHRIVLTREKEELELFQNGLKKTSNVWKEIQKIQKELRRFDNSNERAEYIKTTIMRYDMDRKFFCESYKALQTKTLSGTCVYAAKMIFCKCYIPEYWLDKSYNINQWKCEEGQIPDMLADVNMDSGSKWFIEENRIRKIVKAERSKNDTKDKSFDMIREEDIKNLSLAVQKVKFQDTYQEYDPYATLLINLPAYLREYERLDYSYEEAAFLMEALKNHKGNWILIWKNYVTKPMRENFTGSKKQRAIYHADKKSVSEYRNLLKKLEEISDVHVLRFKYTSGADYNLDISKSVPGSLLFITNINIDSLNIEEFKKEYGFEGISAEMIKQSMKEFNKDNVIAF